MQEPSSGIQLGELSRLAARGFASTEHATAAVLELLTRQLGMRTSFLSRIAPSEERSEVLAAHNLPGGCGVEPGALIPLPDTF